jgi:hypothetical protein
MKIGTEQIKHKILRKLKKHNAVLKGAKYGEFADELAEEIISLIGDDVNSDMKNIAIARGATPEAIKAYERVCKAFDRHSLPFRNQNDYEVYIWIVEQDSTNKTIEKFAQWARFPENLTYINQYFKDPQNIKTQWARAFSNNMETFKQNEDGSLYV